MDDQVTDDDDNDENNDNNNVGINNIVGINNNDVAQCEEQNCVEREPNTLLGKRHGADCRSPLALLSKRYCAAVERDHDELIVETALLGERHSAERRGVNIFGAVPANTSLPSVFRAVSRGVIFNLRSMSPPPDELIGLRRIIGSGGALVRNSVMCKAVKDLYNLPLVINSKSDSAVGAALAAKRFL